jgi:hypothetical protein
MLYLLFKKRITYFRTNIAKMKDQTSIIIAAAAFAYLAVRLYQKYIKKDTGNKSSSTKRDSFSSSKDDDYEPYSKK